MTRPEDILDFWFADGRTVTRPVWFQRDASFDAAIGTRFGALLEPARTGALDGWSSQPEGSLALLLLLDQFHRNLFRGHRDAFAGDDHARGIARHVVLEQRQDLALPAAGRIFLYLPFEHSEAMADQDLSVALFEGLRDVPVHRAPGGSIDYAWRHRQVIRRFGRFPHRNAALGRDDTLAESRYLAEPGAGF